MNFLENAVRKIASRRALGLTALAGIGMLLPTSAMAAEGDNIHLTWTANDRYWLIASFILGLIALAYGLIYLRGWVLSQSPGSEKMQSVGLAIKEGALAYLRQQIRMMSIFIVVLFLGLVGLYWRLGSATAIEVAVCFLLGVFASYIAGYSGMLMAVNGNMRTANAALTSYKRSLEVAFRSGAVAGMVTVGVGLVGASAILFLFPDKATTLLVGFGFGGSLAALFMRVGGGIFTKAADVGADLVGKVEAGIPEDDPRNPATIADNVGDNVGDCAGMAADVFESYEVTLVAAIVLGAATASIFDTATWTRLVIFALAARGVGIIASMIGIQSVRGSDDIDSDPLAAIRKGFYASAGIAIVATGVLGFFLMGGTGKPIQTTQLIPVQKFAQDEARLVQSIRADRAKSVGKAVEDISPADVVSDTRAEKAGLTKDDEGTVGQDLNQSLDDAAALPNLAGYTEADPTVKNEALDYAIAARPKPGATDFKPFQSASSAFLGSGTDGMVVAQVHIKANIPAAPAQGPNPARAAQKIDHTSWVGPVRSGDLDDQIKNGKDNAKKQNIDATIEIVGEKIPAKLYVSEDKKLAIGIEDKVTRPQQLLLQMSRDLASYYPIEAGQMNDIATKAGQPGAKQPPQPKPLQLAVVHHQVVAWYLFVLAIAFGLVMAFLIEQLTDYYVSTNRKPVQEVASVSSTGAATMIIQGFAYACESSVFMVFAIVIALMVPLFLFTPALFGGYILSFYGIALVGLGLLTTTGYILAMDTFGPISDNAQGIFEMSGADEGNEAGAKAVGRLDAAGNTTKALTKGFAIATAVVAAVALFHSYLEAAQLQTIGLRLDVPEIFLGLLVGGAAPFLFSAFSINAVGRSAYQLINEVRRQFREDPGIMLGTSKPDYARCVAIVTAAAQKELLGPGIIAIALPVAVAFGFSIGKEPTVINGVTYNLTGAEALGGFLAGAILTGQLMAVLLANSGGMWDNAKKVIEDGKFGGKGSDAHKAAVVCDTVGDPFKDTAGPALNPLIKVMNLVALLLAGVVVLPLSNGTLSIITLCAVGALAFTVYNSKKTSMSSEMEAQMVKPIEAGAVEAPAKKRITVEETEDESK